MKMIIKEEDMREKGPQKIKVMEEKKKNIKNIKEFEKAMIKGLLRKNKKVKKHSYSTQLAN